MTTAIQVPTWRNTSKEIPGGLKFNSSEPITRWPELEIGKNSVNP
jgi:hypothetical protein